MRALVSPGKVMETSMYPLEKQDFFQSWSKPDRWVRLWLETGVKADGLSLEGVCTAHCDDEVSVSGCYLYGIVPL